MDRNPSEAWMRVTRDSYEEYENPPGVGKHRSRRMCDLREGTGEDGSSPQR